MTEIDTPVEPNGAESQPRSQESPAETPREWDADEVEDHREIAPGSGLIGTLIPAAVVLAEAEGLGAHARSVAMRL